MENLSTDILIAGGSFGGVAAALAATEAGANVILTEETRWLGGQATTQGVPLDEHPWIEHFGCTASYRKFRNNIRQYYRNNYPMLFPHASVGWDNTQRNPAMNTAVINSTPNAFEACLHKTKQYIDSHPEQPPLITINSWNEWTEGSYLLPDMRWGYAYLEAIKKVFLDIKN